MKWLNVEYAREGGDISNGGVKREGNKLSGETNECTKEQRRGKEVK